MFLVPASCLHTVRSCRHVASVVSLSVRTSLQCTCSGYIYRDCYYNNCWHSHLKSCSSWSAFIFANYSTRQSWSSTAAVAQTYTEVDASAMTRTIELDCSLSHPPSFVLFCRRPSTVFLPLDRFRPEYDIVSLGCHRGAISIRSVQSHRCTPQHRP